MSILVEGYFRKKNVSTKLDELDIDKSEKEHLLKIIYDIAEARMLDGVLERLEEEDKELFLEQIHGGSTAIVAEFLRGKIENIEELLTERAVLLEKELIDEIKSLGRS